jgi:hypothetical protein
MGLLGGPPGKPIFYYELSYMPLPADSEPLELRKGLTWFEGAAVASIDFIGHGFDLNAALKLAETATIIDQ